jgi:hypothetical protein
MAGFSAQEIGNATSALMQASAASETVKGAADSVTAAVRSVAGDVLFASPKPWSEFLACRAPTTPSSAVDRVKGAPTQIKYFWPNYVTLCLICVVLAVISTPFALLWVGLCSGATYTLLFTEIGASFISNPKMRMVAAVPMGALSFFAVFAYASDTIWRIVSMWIFFVAVHLCLVPTAQIDDYDEFGL